MLKQIFFYHAPVLALGIVLCVILRLARLSAPAVDIIALIMIVLTLITYVLSLVKNRRYFKESYPENLLASGAFFVFTYVFVLVFLAIVLNYLYIIIKL